MARSERRVEALLRVPLASFTAALLPSQTVSLPRIYIETTIPSYLTARRSRDLRIAADQETTEEWWETQRRGYELFISETVLDEAAAGDVEFAARRLAVLDGVPRLALTTEAAALATRLLSTEIIPTTASPDALHLAIAAAHGMDFLLTWNCRHIHNLMLERRIQATCQALGFECPIICTPAELMET